MKILGSDLRTRYRKALLLLAALCSVLILNEIFGNRGWVALHHQKKDFESLQQQILKLQEENQRLENEVKALKNDPRAIEREAREQLHFVGPRDMVISMSEKDAKGSPPHRTEKGKN